ncbi:MAG: SDR family NAD(P)-dependent oxidoreductase [Pseudomonadota bacterium]
MAGTAPATLVTGGNRGIGAALVERLAPRGPTIATARALPKDKAHGGAEWLALDVTDAAAFETLAHRLDGRPVGLLVCNAGVFVDRHENLADGFAPQLWADTFAVNVTAVFQTVQALLPSLQAAASVAGHARVAVISSQMGSSERAHGSSYIYRASKAAATNLAMNLARDLEGLGIAVAAYHPGWVRTDMGGPSAAISVEESAAGLVAQFEALTLETTGRFLTWDGHVMPF